MNLGEEFKRFLSTPLGIELLATLNERHDSLVRDAEESEGSKQNALLNRAYGVRLAIEHLQFRAFTPRPEGSTNKTK